MSIVSDSFDTFDWRLFEASVLLYQSGDALILRQLLGGDILLHQPIERTPKFVWDLPEGALKERLEPIIEMRALLKLTRADLFRTSYRIFNKDDKTVVRLISETFEPKNQENDRSGAKLLQIEPVRGYPKPAQKLRRQLETMGLGAEPDNLMAKMLETGDRTPGDYRSALRVELDPHMRADEATKTMLRSALKIIRLNEAGIIEDIDTEFLHDFRVAVRRTRSVLSQVKGVFPEEVTQRFRAEFAAIGRLSNELRDLDVYLLAEDSFKAMLPAAVRSDIDPLFEYMRQKRVAALQKVIEGLNSAPYAETIQAWQSFLDEPVPASPAAARGAIPIKPLIDISSLTLYFYRVPGTERIAGRDFRQNLNLRRLTPRYLLGQI